MDFIWNVPAAEQVRASSERAMEAQAGNMDRAAGELLMQATRVEAEAVRLQATLPIMRTITGTTTEEREGTRTNSKGEEESYTYTAYVEYTREVEDAVAIARVEAEIAQRRRLVEALRREAKELSDEARLLLQKKASTNAMFDELFRMAQETDYRYAARIAIFKSDIQRYMARILELRDSIGYITPGGSTIGALLNNQNAYLDQWEMSEYILSRRTRPITPAEFRTLAWFYSKLDTLEGQQRFLNMFLEPVNLPDGVSALPNHPAFSICPHKIAGVQRHIDSGIDELLSLQMGLDHTGNEYRIVQRNRDHLMNLSALLTMVNSLTDHNVEIALRQHADPGIQQRVLLGGFNDQPITLTAGDERRTIVTFNQGSVFTHLIQADSPGNFPSSTIRQTSVQHGNITPPEQGIHLTQWYKFDGNESQIAITSVLGGAGVAWSHLQGETNHHLIRHAFDLETHITTQLINSTASSVLGGLLSLAPGGVETAASHVINFGNIFTSIPSARAEAERRQQEVLSRSDMERFRNYQSHFAYRGVVIHGNGPPQILTWPTVLTFEAVDALDHVLRNNRLADITPSPENITQLHFTREQYMENPTAVFEVYRALGAVGIYELDKRINHNTSARENGFTAQAEREAEATRQEAIRQERLRQNPPPMSPPLLDDHVPM